MNKSLKTTTTIIFLPFFRAILVGNALFFSIPFYFDGHTLDVIVYFSKRDMTLLLVLANGLVAWVFFYLVVAVLLKKGERFERLFDFSKVLKITAVFGVCSLVYGFAEQFGDTWGVYIWGFIYIFYIFFLLIPIVIFETVQLGMLVEKTKGYGRFKSQFLSFGFFLFLPFVVTYLARFIFMTFYLGGA